MAEKVTIVTDLVVYPSRGSLA